MGQNFHGYEGNDVGYEDKDRQQKKNMYTGIHENFNFLPGVVAYT
jgi:hypothetical protein